MKQLPLSRSHQANGALLVRNTRKEDSGNYICAATSAAVSIVENHYSKAKQAARDVASLALWRAVSTAILLQYAPFIPHFYSVWSFVVHF